MPDANQEKRYKEREDGPHRRESGRGKVAHQGHQQWVEDVSLQPVGEGDMPAVPELDKTIGRERPVEVFR
jgi:hypothetical protein